MTELWLRLCAGQRTSTHAHRHAFSSHRHTDRKLTLTYILTHGRHHLKEHCLCTLVHWNHYSLTEIRVESPLDTMNPRGSYSSPVYLSMRLFEILELNVSTTSVWKLYCRCEDNFYLYVRKNSGRIPSRGTVLFICLQSYRDNSAYFGIRWTNAFFLSYNWLIVLDQNYVHCIFISKCISNCIALSYYIFLLCTRWLVRINFRHRSLTFAEVYSFKKIPFLKDYNF